LQRSRHLLLYITTTNDDRLATELNNKLFDWHIYNTIWAPLIYQIFVDEGAHIEVIGVQTTRFWWLYLFFFFVVLDPGFQGRRDTHREVLGVRFGLSVMDAWDAPCPIPLMLLFWRKSSFATVVRYIPVGMMKWRRKTWRRGFALTYYGVQVGSNQADNTNIATASIQDIHYDSQQPVRDYIAIFHNKASVELVSYVTSSWPLEVTLISYYTRYFAIARDFISRIDE
jgi:hypothetical protein